MATPGRARDRRQAGGGRGRVRARVGHALVLLAEEEDDRGGGGGGLGRTMGCGRCQVSGPGGFSLSAFLIL